MITCKHYNKGFCEIEQAFIPLSGDYCRDRCSAASLPKGRRLAHNFLKAVAKHAVNRKERSKSEQERVLAICQRCDNYLMVNNQPRCKHYNCGCFLERKVKWDSENCPELRWYPFKKDLFLNADGDKLNLNYTGTVIFICNGSSVKDLDIDKIKSYGLPIFGVNEGASIIKPTFATLQDSPDKFSDSIWLDCNITKFTDINNSEKKIKNGLIVKNCPAVIYHRRSTDLTDISRWFSKEHISWGDTKEHRSSFLAMIHIAYCLGFSRILLLGADFKMDKETPYFYEWHKGDGHASHNNQLYRYMNATLQKAKPMFDIAGLEIINCTKNSGLTAFEYKDIYESIV